ncbi:MAG: methyltransferase domain-containing protein [Dinoroseobacter sp.]|nr:methyltransferase domain-containing protein [Dinoroseobacter sp.]
MIDDEALTRDCFLGGRLQLWQPREGYRAGTDPVLLAAAVPAAQSDTFLELGCGVGTAALCLALRTGATGVGLELQRDYAELAERNAGASDLPLEVRVGDVHDMPACLRVRSFHHVFLNPPYFAETAGTPSTDMGRDLALRDRSDLATWISAGAKRLNPKGSLTLIARADRLRDILSGLPDSIGSLKLLPLVAREGRAAKRVLVQGRKDGKAPLTLLAPFMLHDGASHLRDGEDFSDAAKKILRDGAALKF